jgi:hypothetical protein
MVSRSDLSDLAFAFLIVLPLFAACSVFEEPDGFEDSDAGGVLTDTTSSDVTSDTGQEESFPTEQVTPSAVDPPIQGWSTSQSTPPPELDGEVRRSAWRRLRGPVSGLSRSFQAKFSERGEPTLRELIAGPYIFLEANPYDDLNYVANDNLTFNHPSGVASVDLMAGHSRWSPPLFQHLKPRELPFPSAFFKSGDTIFAPTDEDIFLEKPQGLGWQRSRRSLGHQRSTVYEVDDTIIGNYRSPDLYRGIYAWSAGQGWKTLRRPDSDSVLEDAFVIPGTRPSGSDASRLPTVVIVRLENNEVLYSKNLGDSWEPLKVDNLTQQKLDLSWRALRYMHRNTTNFWVYESESDTALKSTDLETWSVVSSNSIPHDFLGRHLATRETAPAHGPETSVFFRDSVEPLVLSDEGYTRGIDTPVDNQLKGGTYEDGRWIVRTSRQFWHAPSLNGPWSRPTLRLAAPRTTTITGHSMILRDARHHHINPVGGPENWNSISRQTGQLEWIRVSDQNMAFHTDHASYLLQQEQPQDPDAAYAFNAFRVTKEGVESEIPAEFPDKISRYELDTLTEWQGNPTVHLPEEGVFSATNGLSKWQKTGEKITESDTDVVPGGLPIPRATTSFKGNLWAIISLEESDALFRWDQDGNVEVAFTYVDVDGEKRVPSRVFSTSDALIVQTRARSFGDEAPGRTFLVKTSPEDAWAWLADQPPGISKLASFDRRDIRCFTSDSSLFMYTPSAELFRYNPENHNWTRILLPVDYKPFRPRNIDVTEDGHTLLAGSRAGGLFELNL